MISQIKKEAIIEILRYYNFFHEKIETFIPLSHSLTSDSCRVQFSDYDILIKRFSCNRPLERINLTNDIISFLNAHNFPTTLLMTNKFGNSITEYNGWRFSVYSWVSGRSLKPEKMKPDEIYNYLIETAKLLGKFHLLVSNFDFSNISSDCILSVNSLLSFPFGDKRQLKRSFFNSPFLWKIRFKRKKYRIDEWVLKNIREIRNLAFNINSSKQKKKYLKVKFLPIHGDLSWQNLIVKDNKVSGIIDWDNVLIAPFLYDLAIALRMCGENVPHTKAFIKTYMQTVNFDVDIELLIDLLIRKQFKSIKWHLVNFYKGEIRDETLVLDTCIKYLDYIKWLEKNRYTLSNIS